MAKKIEAFLIDTAAVEPLPFERVKEQNLPVLHRQTTDRQTTQKPTAPAPSTSYHVLFGHVSEPVDRIWCECCEEWLLPFGTHTHR